MVKVLLLGALIHQCKRYEAGSSLELPSSVANQLVKVGVAEIVQDEPSNEQPEVKKRGRPAKS